MIVLYPKQVDMRKRSIFLMLLFMAVLPSLAFAQTKKPAERIAPYKTMPGWPPLDLLMPDSSRFTKDNLKKQATLIMYFSPDCDHCIHQMEDMNKRISDFDKYQVVMVTHQPMLELAEFIHKYKLGGRENFKVGKDDKFQLPGFYAIKGLPFFAVYNKEGKIISTHESNTSVDVLLKSLGK